MFFANRQHLFFGSCVQIFLSLPDYLCHCRVFFCHCRFFLMSLPGYFFSFVIAGLEVDSWWEQVQILSFSLDLYEVRTLRDAIAFGVACRRHWDCRIKSLSWRSAKGPACGNLHPGIQNDNKADLFNLDCRIKSGNDKWRKEFLLTILSTMLLKKKKRATRKLWHNVYNRPGQARLLGEEADEKL